MDRRTLIVGGAAVVAVGAGAAWYMNSQNAAPGTTQIDPGADSSANVDTSSILEMAQGNMDAPVTITEYASFTCPHCATFHAGPYQQLKSEYIDTNKVKFVYRDVYFDRYGLWASLIARCDPNRFFGISSMLYKQQREWLGGDTPAAIADNLRKLGKVAGLTEEQVAACIGDEAKAETLVAWFEQNAAADNVTATPTLLINGEKHSNMNWPDLKALIDEALEG